MDRRRRPTTHPPDRAGVAGPGFTLLETMLAMVIVLVGVMAVLQAQRAFLFNNLWSTHTATANYLANEIRELTRALPRHDQASGGLYFSTPGDPTTLNGWGLETNEVDIDDIDDLDDLDGVVFGPATTYPAELFFASSAQFPDGPVNSYGEVITQNDWDGAVVTETVLGVERPVALEGWSQLIQVEKVDPYDYGALAVQVSDGGDLDVEQSRIDSRAAEVSGVREVDEYPLRVTVSIIYQSDWTTDEPTLISQVSWIVPP